MSTQNQTDTSTENKVPPTDTFELVLDQLYRGTEPVVKPCKCTFSYAWDFSTGQGMAEIQTMDGDAVHLALHPIGLAGHLDFMSSQNGMYTIGGKQVFIQLVTLHIDLETGDRAAGIVFNEDRSVVQTSAGYNRAKAVGVD